MVLASSAIVAILVQEPGYEGLLERLDSAKVVVVGVPTVLESMAVLTARLGQDARPLVHGLLRNVRAEVIPFDEEHLDAAMSAFLRYGCGRHVAGLNFGDCLSYAVASVAGMPLLFAGGRFSDTDAGRG